MLIKCPECGTEVSDLAAQCPKCAYPIKKVVSKSEDQGCFLQTMNMGCSIIGVIVIFLVILIIIAMLGNHK